MSTLFSKSLTRTGCSLVDLIDVTLADEEGYSMHVERLTRAMLVREGSSYRIGWIFGKIPSPPLPLFTKLYCKFFMTSLVAYARRYDGQIVWNVCTWFPEIGTILRGGGWGSTAVWNLSGNSSVSVPWPVPSKTGMTTRAFFKVCLVLIFSGYMLE